MEVKNIMWGN